MWSWIKGLFGGQRGSPDFAAEDARREEARWQGLITGWPFPLRLVSGADATAAWYEEMAIGAREGFSPILITPKTEKIPEDVADLADGDIASPDTIVDAYVRRWIYEGWAFHRPTARAFEDASPEEIAAALATSEDYSRGGAYAFDSASFADLEDLPPEPPEPEPEAQRFLTANSFLLKGPFPQVAITRLPTPDSWRAPLLLGIGGWNACPRPAELTAFARRWKLLRGADSQPSPRTRWSSWSSGRRPPSRRRPASRKSITSRATKSMATT